MNNFWHLILLLLILTDCSSAQRENYDKSQIFNYYFEFADEDQTSISKNAIKQISNQIDGKIYIITSGSAKGEWPYYTEVLDANNFPKDSILLPHPRLHRLLDIQYYEPEDKRHYKVLTTIYPSHNDTLKIGIVVSKKTKASKNWEQIVDVGIHNYAKKNYVSDSELINHVSEYIVFATFK